MLVTLLKRWDKTPQLVSISNTSHSGLLNLQLRADTAITAFLKAHTGLEFTNLWGIMFNSWENLKKWVRKWHLATPAMYSASYTESFVRTSAVCLSVCLCFLCSDACHVTLPFAFGRSLSTLHSCVDLVCDVVLSLPLCSLLYSLPSFCQWSNRVTSKTDGKEMSGVVKVKNEPQR